ncbi:MAG: DUF1566 domain-containing protein [Desulfobulbaceae bacterium]|nr:DUF1566 domain-containing protein [Desulfobulbaceae bacterium]HIJ78582.1 DUF1566 domain-containing protein [Deltaproteobacteria bacterium]
MGLADKLGMAKGGVCIDWDLSPADTFGTFESWGGRERVRNNDELFYYFYIDNWAPPAKLYLMERGVKHAKIIARVDSPQELLDHCVAAQGFNGLDKNYAIDQKVKAWLLNNIFEREDFSGVHLVDNSTAKESLKTGLPGKDAPVPEVERVQLRTAPMVLREDDLPALVRRHNFYDSRNNPAGGFDNYLIDNQDNLTVSDAATGLMWQRGGCDLTTIRNVHKYVAELNRTRFAGHNDWRLPTLEEAMSLLENKVNGKGVYLHPCFSKEQPFIFLADCRKPGGYWFVDFKQGTPFWASGSIPGGFGRVCRSL